MDLPGSNSKRFTSSRDFGAFRVRAVTRGGVGQYRKLAGKAAPRARRLEA